MSWTERMNESHPLHLLLCRLGTEEMGQELDTRESSLAMQCLQSRTSSFDQQLWDELEAQARRRRSTEGTFERGLVSREAANAASPFARQLATSSYEFMS